MDGLAKMVQKMIVDQPLAAAEYLLYLRLRVSTLRLTTVLVTLCRGRIGCLGGVVVVVVFLKEQSELLSSILASPVAP